jgi:hypothetical protein
VSCLSRLRSVRRLRPRLRLVPLVALVLLGSACEVRTRVQVTVEEDGSGVVEVAVGLDREALARVPDLDDDGTSDVTDLVALVRTDDLEAAGWRVQEPREAGSGTTWIRVSKPFATPSEANAVLAEVSGPSGPLRDLRLSRSTGFASTKLSFSGTADLSGGLEAFGDSGLSQALDGEPLGEDASQIEQRIGEPLADAFRVDVVVDLPGGLSANTDDRAGGAARWSPRLGSSAEDLSATWSVRHWPVLLLTVLAGLCIVAGVAAAVRLVLAGRGPQGEGERDEDGDEPDIPGWRHPPPVATEDHGSDVPGWRHPPPRPPQTDEIPEVPDETAPVPSDPDEVPGWRHPPPVP